LETGSAVEVGLEEVADEVQEVEVGRRMVEKEEEEREAGVMAE
jgi:hypothetical protein